MHSVRVYSSVTSRTAQRRVVPGYELGEEVREERLQRRGALEQQPARGQEHVVRVPRLAAVKQVVARVERPAERAVVRRVELVDRVECAIGDGGRVDEQVADERV